MPLTCVHPHHHHAGTIRVDYTLLVSWKLASDLLDKRSHMGRVAFSVSVILLACCSNPERRWDTSDVQEELWCLTQTYRWISVAMGTQLTVVMNSSTWDVRRGVKGQTGTSWRVQWKKKKKIPIPPTLVHIGPLPALDMAKRIWKMHCAICSRPTGCRGKLVTLLANILHTTTHFPALIKMVQITICHQWACFIMLKQN